MRAQDGGDTPPPTPLQGPVDGQGLRCPGESPGESPESPRRGARVLRPPVVSLLELTVFAAAPIVEPVGARLGVVR